jgi:protein-L-isoaspartate(D-aspartate) O-methyltransferase
MLDTFKHQGMRRKLAAELQSLGVTDSLVLKAIESVPRHLYLDPVFEKQSYENIAFQIGAGQTISQPFTVAFQSQLLELSKGDKVLEIGTGSGYQTAVLLELGAKVFSIERQRELFDKTKPLLTKLGYQPKLFYGDGYKGKPAFAPFDKIIITCGAPFIPQDLVDQLKVGGIIVIPVGEGRTQEMKRGIKQPDGKLKIENYGTFSFVPMLEEKE